MSEWEDAPSSDWEDAPAAKAAPESGVSAGDIALGVGKFGAGVGIGVAVGTPKMAYETSKQVVRAEKSLLEDPSGLSLLSPVAEFGESIGRDIGQGRFPQAIKSGYEAVKEGVKSFAKASPFEQGEVVGELASPVAYLKGAKLVDRLGKAATATEQGLNLGQAGERLAGLKGISKLGKAVARDYRTGEMLPKTKGAAESVSKSIKKTAETAKARAASERAAAEQKALAEHSDAQKDAMSTAEQAKRDAAQRAKEAGSTSTAEIRKQRGLQTAAERDAEDSMTHAGLTEHKTDFGDRIRSDVADAHLEARMRVEAEGVYSEWDKGLESLDQTNPFQMSVPGMRFFEMLQKRIKPSLGGGVLRQQAADEAVAARIKNQLIGKSVSEEVRVPLKIDPITNTVSEWGTALKTGSRPRFGKAIENALKDIRYEQAEAGRARNYTLQKRYEQLGNELEKSLNEWAGNKYPREKFAQISERSNQLNTDAVEKTLDKTGAEQLRPEQKIWSTNSDSLPDLWFGGKDRAAELRSIVGEKKFAAYAEERVSSQIAGKSADQALKWAGSESNAWIDTVPGLRNKVDSYAERMARFSGDRKQIEAVIAGEKQRLATLGKETKSAIKDARATRGATIAKSEAAKDKALQTAAKTQESRMAAAQKMVDFMAGKRPSVAMQSWDQLAETARAAGITSQELGTIRSQLEAALQIENKSEQWRKLRQIMYPVFGVSAVTANRFGSVSEVVSGSK